MRWGWTPKPDGRPLGSPPNQGSGASTPAAAHLAEAMGVERRAVLAYLEEEIAIHEALFAIARALGDEAAMDRCAARCRTARDIFNAIRSGVHRP